jgi:putative tryptophan/tyrosine transport system substrate-binding protein
MPSSLRCSCRPTVRLARAVMSSYAGVRDPAEIAQRFATFARDPNGALVVLPGPVVIRHREAIIVAAARYRLPAIYPYRFFTADGGLMSYGSDIADLHRRAAPAHNLAYI